MALGAIGGGYAEVTSGVTAGQLVVLADTTAPLPANGSNTRRSFSSGGQQQSGMTVVTKDQVGNVTVNGVPQGQGVPVPPPGKGG